MESVLTSLKKLLGVAEDNIHFDTDICILANGAFMVLTQIGVGPALGFSITDKVKVWTDFLPAGPIQEGSKNYVYMKIKLTFDPPTTAAAIEALKSATTELEHRLNLMVEFGTPITPPVQEEVVVTPE
jgi:hypothetical protein